MENNKKPKKNLSVIIQEQVVKSGTGTKWFLSCYKSKSYGFIYSNTTEVQVDCPYLLVTVYYSKGS